MTQIRAKGAQWQSESWRVQRRPPGDLVGQAQRERVQIGRMTGLEPLIVTLARKVKVPNTTLALTHVTDFELEQFRFAGRRRTRQSVGTSKLPPPPPRGRFPCAKTGEANNC